MWPDSYSWWRQIPKYWLAEVIVEASPKGELSMKDIDLVDAADKNAIRNLSTFLFGTRQDSKFPRQLLPKAVMRSYLLEMHKLLGMRTKHVKGGLNEKYEIDWVGIGVYQFNWDDKERATEVTLLDKEPARKYDSQHFIYLVGCLSFVQVG